MTVGYQDFIRESKQSGTLLATGSAVGTGNTFSASFYSGNYNYLIITMDTTTSTHMWAVFPLFTTQNGGGGFMGATSSGLQPGIRDSVVARVRGPWCQLEFTWWDASSTDTATYYVYGTNIAPTGAVGTPGLAGYAYYNSTIGASATVTITGVPWHSGTGFMSAMCNAASGMVVSVDQFEFQLAWQNYINMETGAATQRAMFQEFPISPTPIRFRLVNLTASVINAQFMAQPKTLVAA